MLIPRRDLDFQLFDVLGLGELLARPRFDAHDRDTVDAVLDAAYQLAGERFAPHAARADAEEPRIEDGRVVLPPETGAALAAYAAGGFVAAAFPRPLGGLGLPFLVSQACGGVFAGANVAVYSYALLTQGAANVIARFGTDDQRARYLGAMLEGRAFGTMCLSEPHAGSSLADIRTRAEPVGEGRHRITGRKMWISGGEHELSENIVHLVLARIPGGPAGVKGISLFIVPRYRAATPDGGRGPANGVSLVGLNHKMGWRGHVNAALAFGDSGECLGELVGREHHGLGYMFHMMNEARVTVGLCAVGLGYAGYLHALGYARQRVQGRVVSMKDPDTPQVPILRHPDVRRMLLAQKAWVEGGLALALYCARLVDELASADGEAERQELALLLELLTPVAKSWPSEYCLEANKLAIQVAGGAGYTRDLPLERLYRDNRLNHIHEGTLGIHGLDLLGRKVVQHDGAALRSFLGRVQATIGQALGTAGLQAECRALAAALRALAAVTRQVVDRSASGEPELALANATLYLDAFGTIAVAWRWLAQALVAQRALQDPRPTDELQRDFLEGKLHACRWFYRHALPEANLRLAAVGRLDDATLRIRDEHF
ncbi:MAG: acyl-CoA dehydrogenase [Steroidobacteraceae bacterium]|jgi:butyryl-CoA dehydrogenase|nr:acyl-CoA dehydrogenase [Steroidobacteraceae bacterium]